MKVPDESLYPRWMKHIEEMDGWVYCIHCMNCPMNSNTKLLTKGKWKCYATHKWKDADDIVEYKCRAYRKKSCTNCRNSYCREEKIEGYFCSQYRSVSNRVKNSRMMGRRIVRKDSGLSIIETEEEFNRMISKEIQDEKEEHS